MSKKSKWKVVFSTDPYILLSPEERIDYNRKKKARERKMFKTGLKIDKMPINKLKINKKYKKETEEE